MKKSTIVTLAIITLIIASPFIYLQIKYPSYTYRYRMTVEVETPEGIKSGSSVVQVHTEETMESLKVISIDRMNIRGEGAFVDIADGKTLFVLLNGAPGTPNPHSLIYDAIPYPSVVYTNRDRMRFYGTLKNAKGILPKNKYPIMVYFEDINNPMSVKKVDPENMEEFFGKGVKIKQITIATTRDRLEWKMEKKLPWLSEYRGKGKLDGRRIETIKAENRLANSLGSGSFSVR